MTPPIKSILSCLVILAAASDIHTKGIQKLGPPQEFLAAPGKTIVLGEGMKPSQVTIIDYSVEKGVLYVSIHTQSHNSCNIQFSNLIGTSIDFKTIKQLNFNRVLVLWSVADKEKVVTTLSIIWIEFCPKMVSYSYSSTLLDPISVAVVSFGNGFDLISSRNKLLSFNPDGYMLSGPKLFPADSTDFSISAVSERTRNTGYFIVDHTHQVVKFTILDERKKEWKNSNLLYLSKAQVLTNNEQSLYSACAFNPEHKITVSCYQFDKLGNEKLIRSAQPEFDTVLDVKSVAGGGFVFVALKFKGQFNQLNFVKIGIKLEDVNTWSYSGKETFEGAKLMDFSETDHTFVLAYKTSQVGTRQESAVSQKFSLQN